jgi:hypothetical protein
VETDVSNYFDDNEDLKYYMERGLDWGPLVELLEGNYKHPDGPKDLAEAMETYRDPLQLMGEFVAEQVAPHVAGVDHAGLKLVDGSVVAPPALTAIFQQVGEMGLHGICIPRELGGMNAPMVVYLIAAEMMARADVSMMTHYGFHSAIAMSLLLYSVAEGSTEWDKDTGVITKTRFDKEIREIVAGRAWGSMDITEPNAGSDMAQLNCRAELDSAGNWAVTGQKIFITSGHGAYHVVIARHVLPGQTAEPGLKGLSLYLVPTFETLADGSQKRHVVVDRLEEKLGHHGSATCSVVFDRSPGILIGRVGDGFKHMLLLMNSARLGVGFEALGLSENAYRLAKAYAAERRSMGKTIDRHELIADYLDEMRTDIQGVRALCMYGAYHEEFAQRLRMQEAAGHASEVEAARIKQAVKRHSAKARRVTPLLKYLAAEKSVELARRSLQIHGGVGYTTEYGPEKLLRDSLVTPIYEGTSQIQSLMAMKDTLGAVLKNPQLFVRRKAQASWRSVSARDPLERRVARLKGLSYGAIQHLMTRVVFAKVKGVRAQPVGNWAEAVRASWDPKRDFAYGMLHAERLTKILADVAICEILWKQAVAHADRRDVLERYLLRAEPRCRFLHDEITTTGSRLLEELHPEHHGAGHTDSSKTA